MATITISVGALSRSRTFANDTKASAALLAFVSSYGLAPDTATAAVKLDGVIDWLVGQVVAVSTQQYVESLRAANQTEAKALYGFNNGG